ncbi:MAG: chromosome segregation protein SMC [Candidatus Omnitrophota bacterium]
MYFKELEIVGFKSFLNKTKLKFESGVTAIVGPNGCGKSNIVDAIKWVLGEQSTKAMRSSAMQDVIFNGTEKQEPINAAQVSFTLSNEDKILPLDYDEVTISRKLYRSGESEYLLNKMPVRLADIRSILMGTGIGTSSYSVVEQGNMDMILSSKPEERRYIFEEASGITRYKVKKREAILKLERTQENLVRINDIIREVERQINSIERQARKAERYKTRYEELKDLEIKFACKKLQELSSEKSSFEARSVECKGFSEASGLALDESAASLKKIREEFNLLFEEIQNIQDHVTRNSSDIDKNKRVMEINAERIQELEKYVGRLKWEIEDVLKKKSLIEEKISAMEVKFLDIKEKRLNKEKESASREESFKKITEGIEKCKNEIALTRGKIVDIASEATTSKNALIKINADIENIKNTEQRLESEKRKIQIDRDALLEEFGKMDESVKEAKEELKNKRDSFNAFSGEFSGNQQRLFLLNDEKNKKEKRLHEITPRRYFLEKLLSEREGINPAVKEIMKRLEEDSACFPGVRGILSELVSIKGEYEESMRSLLGDTAQALVVDDTRAMKRVIEYLSRNSMPSVNFVILDELKAISSGEEFASVGKEEEHDITAIVAADEKYRSALSSLLHGIGVEGSLEEKDAFNETNESFSSCILGEKGVILQRGMRRSRNYSVKEQIPLFGRQEKINQMKEEEEKVQDEIKEVDKSLDALEKWIKEAASKKENLEDELNQKQMAFAEMSSKAAAVKDRFNSFSEEFKTLDSRVAEENAARERLYLEATELNKKLNELEVDKACLEQTAGSLEQQIKEESCLREETLISLSDVRAEFSSLKREEESLAEVLEREKEAFENIDKFVEEKSLRINENSERIQKLTEEIKKLKENTLEYIALVEIKSSQSFEKKEYKDALAEAIKREESKVKKSETELEEVRDKLRDLEIQSKELEYKRRALVDKISGAYKTNLESGFEARIDDIANWEEARERIDELKSQLEKIGEVSLGAVEEHNQLQERFQFLTKQRDDLVLSRESLIQAISKINRTTRKMFVETFELVRKEFNTYFRMLFAGGKADLVLEDESNVLECGIDIIVRPPGKKLHNIMQMSGGEKAMTAIALIFAIFKVNPSPFCILDEIDAPLDESNIVRFCQVLQDFLKLSQFVIVTHNRMTIQLADVLYGITMEEKGVSKVVSVKFAEESDTSPEEAVPVEVQ